jgi:hypothetical protein
MYLPRFTRGSLRQPSLSSQRVVQPNGVQERPTKRMEISRHLLAQIIRRVAAAAILAEAALWSLCLFIPHSESGQTLLTMFGGTLGGCLGTAGPGWRVNRLISNGLAGLLSSLILYYCVRGFILRSTAGSSNLRACGMAAFAFLMNMARPGSEGWTKTNKIAGIAAAFLILIFTLQGVSLWQ